MQVSGILQYLYSIFIASYTQVHYKTQKLIVYVVCTPKPVYMLG